MEAVGEDGSGGRLLRAVVEVLGDRLLSSGTRYRRRSTNLHPR